MNEYKVTPVNILKQIINLQNQKEITEMSNKVATCSIGILCKSQILTYNTILIHTQDYSLYILLLLQVSLYLSQQFLLIIQIPQH